MDLTEILEVAKRERSAQKPVQIRYLYSAEHSTAIARLQIAIRQAQRLGLLGSQIFESPFDFKIDIRIGAGSRVAQMSEAD